MTWTPNLSPAAVAPTVTYVERPSRGMAVTSLVLGVVGLSIAWIPILGYFAFPMCLLGFIFGLAAVRKAKRNGRARRCRASAGCSTSPPSASP